MAQMSRERHVVCRARHDWGDDTGVTATLLDALVEALPPDRLRDQSPLYDAVDPDALDALFAPTRQASVRNGLVRFEFVGYTVEVRSTGEVVVYDD
jgi:hypothetical protein